MRSTSSASSSAAATPVFIASAKGEPPTSPSACSSLAGGQPELVEVGDARHAGRRLDRLLELGGRDLGLLDSLRVLGQAKLDEPRAQLADVSPAGALLGQLAHRRDRDRVAHEHPVGDRAARRVEREPGPLAAPLVGAEVDAGARPGSAGITATSSSPSLAIALRGLAGSAQLLLERHGAQQ